MKGTNFLLEKQLKVLINLRKRAFHLKVYYSYLLGVSVRSRAALSLAIARRSREQTPALDTFLPLSLAQFSTLLELTKRAFRCYYISPQTNKSINTNTANTTLAIPFVVANARLTLLRSVGFTNVC